MGLGGVPDAKNYGVFRLGESKKISKFLEKAKDPAIAGKGVININAGIYCFNQEILSRFPEQESFSLENDIFPRFEDGDFFGFETSKKFIDIGTPERFKLAQTFLK